MGWKKLRHPEVLQRIRERTGELRQVSGKAGAAADVGIDGVGGQLALLLRSDDLLFEKRREQFVGVLHRAQRQDVGGVDLVQYGDLAVEAGIARKRVVLQISHTQFKSHRVVA